MRVTAQTVFFVLCCVLTLTFFSTPAYAQTTPSPVTDTASTNTTYVNNLNTDPNVPLNHHTFAQVQLIDILSAAMCQLTGIDPTDPSQSCLGVDPTTGKIGIAPSATQQFGMAQTQQPLGGAVGVMTTYISSLYVPAIGTSQYFDYLSSNFGVAKPAYAQTKNCNTSPFGYGFCGLSPMLTLWSDVRDLSYALLTILFIAIGIGRT